jgi:hypothetical protein
MSTTVQTATDIRPFHVDTLDEELAELHRRISATLQEHRAMFSSFR